MSLENDEQSAVHFAAICDGRPEDRLSSDPGRLHTFGIIQDETPDDLMAFAGRISDRMCPSQLGHWAGKSISYRERFALAFCEELLASGGRVHIYEAAETQIVQSIPLIEKILPTSVGLKIKICNGNPCEISANGITFNERTRIGIYPVATWSVGAVVTWMAMAITDFFEESVRQSIYEKRPLPIMTLLPDRLPLDSVDSPGATSLLRAILNGTIRNRIHQQYAGIIQPDNLAEKLIDNIVGSFNQRHQEPESRMCQIINGMIESKSFFRHLSVISLDKLFFERILEG
jgi:hypothetical protein